MNFMRLSSMNAAHVAVAWCRVQEIRVSRSFFARCGVALLPPSDLDFSEMALLAQTFLTPCKSRPGERLYELQKNLCFVSGHDFRGCGKTLYEGHGFSRAAKAIR
jgi:hypothetical protein